MTERTELARAAQLNPRRHTTQARSIAELVAEQLQHFGIPPDSEHTAPTRAQRVGIRPIAL